MSEDADLILAAKAALSGCIKCYKNAPLAA